jgi:hypothetical protein
VARLVQIARGEAPAVPAGHRQGAPNSVRRGVVTQAEEPPPAAPALSEVEGPALSEVEGPPPAPAEVQPASQGGGPS